MLVVVEERELAAVVERRPGDVVERVAAVVEKVPAELLLLRGRQMHEEEAHSAQTGFERPYSVRPRQRYVSVLMCTLVVIAQGLSVWC